MNNQWDYVPKSKGVYLTLKSKGDSIKIRLTGDYYHFHEEFKGQLSERFGWVVLDKTDPKDIQVKAYKMPVSIYTVVRAYAVNPDWGDPTKYDITITRTEQQGSYYLIQPSPAKSELTPEEKKMIEGANLDLPKLFAPKEATDQEVKSYQDVIEPPAELTEDGEMEDPFA